MPRFLAVYTMRRWWCSGGFGTLDELFEVLNLRLTGKSPPVKIVMVDRKFWETAINFKSLVEAGTIVRADCELFDYAEDAEGAWSKLEGNLGAHR